MGRGIYVAMGCALALFAAPAADAALLWQVNYDDGTLGGWQQLLQGVPGRISVAASPTDPTRNVMRVELQTGDDYNGSNRSEALARHGDPDTPSGWPDGDNAERWYGWRTYLRPDFPIVPKWTVFAQSHNDDDKRPPLAMVIVDGLIDIHTATMTLWQSYTPIQTGQ